MYFVVCGLRDAADDPDAVPEEYNIIDVFSVFGFSPPVPHFDFSDLGDSGAIVEDMTGQTALGMIVANLTNSNYGTVVCRSRTLEAEFLIKFQ